MSHVYKLRDDDEEDELEPRAALPFDDDDDDVGDDDENRVPTTAEEYLRMVRRQARKVPDVVYKPLEKEHVKPHTFRLSYEDLATCDEKLLCKLSWEKTFLDEFTALRQTLQDHINAYKAVEVKLPSRKNDTAWSSFCFGDDATAPTPLLLAKMDAAVKNEVLWIFSRLLLQQDSESGSERRLDAHASCWLFALLAVIDKPTDADTGAALRSILRSLCSIRAHVSDPNDPSLTTVNILITILGVFFGQMPARADATAAPQASTRAQADAHGQVGWDEGDEGAAAADDGDAYGEAEYEEEEEGDYGEEEEEGEAEAG